MMNSRRAAILKRVLGYINSGDFDESGEFLIFGKEAFERHMGSLRESFGFEDPLRELLSNAKVKRGKVSVQKRISLEQPSNGFTEDELRAWQELITKHPVVFEALNAAAFEPVLTATADEAEDRDAALALEALQWLDHAAARLDGLHEFAVGGLARNQPYFEEAHWCDLAGLKIATAVLCRAVLESALKQVVDPNKTIERTKRSGESHIQLMLEEAKRTGRLDGERVKAGLKIRDAGNDAIHDLPKFRASYWAAMNSIVDDTRKVLEDLYG